MPVFNLDLKNNNGTKTFIKGTLSPLSGAHTISENTITNCYFDSIDEKSDDTTYNSDIGLLTLPVKMKGLSKTINATTPDEGMAVGDSFNFSVGDNNLYVIPTTESKPYIIQEDTLTGIADSIRGVNGETNKYTPEEMKTKISALKDPKGSVTIAVNGTYDVSQKATAIVEVPDTPTQEKNFTISDNNTYSVEPDTGYALSKVLVTGNFSNPTLSGTATTRDVLAGKTFYNTSYTLQNGGIQTYGGATTITSNTTLATAGMYLEKNLIINVPNPTLSGNAIASQVLKGQKFYSNTYTLLTGTMESYSGDFTVTENKTLATAGKYLNSDIVVEVPTSEGVTEVSTSSEMDALLGEANVGKYYKYTGTTDDKYTNGDIYQVERDG